MTFYELANTILRIDQLVNLKATGSPLELSKRLGISERSLYNHIETMKNLGAPIKYCRYTRRYYYESQGRFEIGFKNVTELSDAEAQLTSGGFSSMKNFFTAKFLQDDHLT